MQYQHHLRLSKAGLKIHDEIDTHKVNLPASPSLNSSGRKLGYTFWELMPSPRESATQPYGYTHMCGHRKLNVIHTGTLKKPVNQDWEQMFYHGGARLNSEHRVQFAPAMHIFA